MTLRNAVLALVVVTAACHQANPAPPKSGTELDAYERDFLAESRAGEMVARARGQTLAESDIQKSYRAVYIGSTGVFVDRKLVASLGELVSKRAALVAAIDANGKAAPSFGFSGISVTFDIDDQPAAAAIDALRLFAGRKTFFNYRVTPSTEPTKFPHATREIFFGTLRAEPKPATDAEMLSIELATDRTWVGLAHAQAFQELPDKDDMLDLERLEKVLHEHKESALFAQRQDIELAASGGTAGDVLHVMEVTTKAGFTDLAVLPFAKLSARVRL